MAAASVHPLPVSLGVVVIGQGVVRLSVSERGAHGNALSVQGQNEPLDRRGGALVVYVLSRKVLNGPGVQQHHYRVKDRPHVEQRHRHDILYRMGAGEQREPVHRPIGAACRVHAEGEVHGEPTDLHSQGPVLRVR